MPTFKIPEDTRIELDKYREYMRKQEYTDTSVVGYRTYLSRFLRKAGVPKVSALKASVEVFLEVERVKNPQTFKYCRAALRLYYKMVTSGHLKSSPAAISTPEIASLLGRFRKYSLEIKNLGEDTVASEASHVQGFLEHTYENNPQGFINGLTAEDIRRYVVDRLAALSDSSKGRMITSIRNFFRCQSFYGQPAHPSVFRLPLSPAVWKKSAFPTTIDMDIFNVLHLIPDVKEPLIKSCAPSLRSFSVIHHFVKMPVPQWVRTFPQSGV